MVTTVVPISCLYVYKKTNNYGLRVKRRTTKVIILVQQHQNTPTPNQAGTRLSGFLSDYVCPAAKVMKSLLLPTVNTHLVPAADQPAQNHYCTATTHMSDITTGFNQTKPSHRTIFVVVDLKAAIDTLNHNVLISNIVRSTLSEVTCRWLSNYIRGRQSVTVQRQSSSSCQQTVFFHSSTHCFPTSLNVIRSSKELECASWEQCNMCATCSSTGPMIVHNSVLQGLKLLSYSVFI